MAELRVAVVGAGIGGLTAAIAMRANGIDATVYEQAHELKALGAGVSIATNGSRILNTLGVGAAVAAIAGPVTHYQFRTWQAEPIAGEPSALGFGDPATTWCLHRGEFQKVLAGALPVGALQLGRSCVGAAEHRDGVHVEFADGTTVDADLLVGADGIHSRLQGRVARAAEPVSEGIMAYRGLIPADRVRGVVDVHASSMWLGPRQSFLAYPVSAGALLNIVAFVPTTLTVAESWTAPGDVAELAAAYQGWDPTVLSIIEAMDSTFRWGIYDREPLERWSTDRITLLGDSAHAVTPHLGQGANQAIEDAMTLAVLLRGAQPEQIGARLRRYEDLRMSRTRHVRRQARAAGLVYRSTELAPRAQAEQLHAILDSVAINTYDAERVALDADVAA
ncbi:FAD-dependent monooxygenase [Mycolicibacterium peregrinum]|uniref:Salicylate hydroxylase n=1 Tax=Mycolicibacterium peregrinum TaxID=43304 RepID=A0A4Z0HL72_MYCPR|nr:FAD-dependent monooxygenase [Mycolicibacterium peregrinum]TGB38569.1 salicylate hydroxylase [Mycolicibacterium peregrinum]TGB38696.1 salicylate hydroxylase [Mycolicibacterium peregrinum]